MIFSWRLRVTNQRVPYGYQNPLNSIISTRPYYKPITWKDDDGNDFYMSITGNPIRHAKYVPYKHPGVTAQNPENWEFNEEL
jgi:hypothetical protein